MNLRDQQVRFRLSEEGRQALRGLVSQGEVFDGFVVDQDRLGAWILIPGRQAGGAEELDQVALVKWDHVSSVILPYMPGEGE